MSSIFSSALSALASSDRCSASPESSAQPCAPPLVGWRRPILAFAGRQRGEFAGCSYAMAFRHLYSPLRARAERSLCLCRQRRWRAGLRTPISCAVSMTNTGESLPTLRRRSGHSSSSSNSRALWNCLSAETAHPACRPVPSLTAHPCCRLPSRCGPPGPPTQRTWLLPHPGCVRPGAAQGTFC